MQNVKVVKWKIPGNAQNDKVGVSERSQRTEAILKGRHNWEELKSSVEMEVESLCGTLFSGSLVILGKI